MLIDEIKSYIEKNNDLMLRTHKELCAIPAPSHKELKRAEYCKAWLEQVGAEGVYIDEALNVIFPLGCEDSNAITVFAAHTDTVFPDTEPMPYHDDGEKIHCPGVADNTAGVAVLLMMAKFFIEKKCRPAGGILFVCNSCEEGLGNLKGTRQLFQCYGERIRQFISFDSQIDVIADRCVGSHRYEVEVQTEGGHSYLAFGNANAICELSKIVTAIYNIQAPASTTYNVGSISGGTSVNTIAQSAKMLCEYRSSDRTCLAQMKEEFERIFEEAQSDEVQVNVRKIGDRPCSNIDDAKIERLRQILKPLIEEVIHTPVRFNSSSTDSNIPLSMGIPAMTIGIARYGGMHTRQEWVEKASLAPGLEIAIKTALRLTEVAL